jgi:2-oxo-4-hydroxy-4-carboxy-5-ureidoimidazoline decarboxylase
VTPGRRTIEDLDSLVPSEAAGELGPLFEGAPQFLARLVGARPFGTWDGLFDRARTIAHAMPEPEQVDLINAHPRLGAALASVSAASFHEQGYDREQPAAPAPGQARDPGRDPARDPAGDPALDRLEELNDAYERAFGFRYCVFVAGRPLAALVPELEAALAADRDAELDRALDAVVDIARARHLATALDPARR